MDFIDLKSKCHECYTKKFRQKKRSGGVEECVFVNPALKIQCQIVKNILLQTDFSVILPTGLIFIFRKTTES